jgi:CO/xanthine dehydrogenase FAD-binding subunit
VSGPRLLRPDSLAEALSLLAEPEARCLAGGATLVAMMNAGLVESRLLVALDGITALSGIIASPEGGLRIGAMTRHRETAADARLAGSLAMVRQAAGVIANPVVRNMGTMGGSIAFADPAADYPPALVAADAEIEIAHASGNRRLPAREFFLDWYTTALEPGEMVTAIHLPPPTPARSIASLALALDGESLRIAIGGCGPTPLRLDAAEAALAGRLEDPRAIAEAAALLVVASDPVDDVRGSADYRRRLIPRLLAAALADLREAREAA